ncbi:MAG: phospholipase D family protein [Dehalococcoidia bacterium]|nr:phospholipase D family protein [Dehalococcoidia bacterium]
MAKFLDTTGVSYHLQQLINGSAEKLVLISPYLRISERLKQSIADKDRMKLDIRIVFGKNDLEPSEHNWLRSLRSVRTSYLQNLHAKCYLNEKEAIVTSMNLYDFSQINNNEMGIYLEKGADAELYDSLYTEAMRLVRISEEVQITVAQVPKNPEATAKVNSGAGFCVRCHTELKLNPMVPYCPNCYKEWRKFKNDEYEEKFCHICGKPNKSTLVKPSCYDCYKTNKDTLEFPLQ